MTWAVDVAVVTGVRLVLDVRRVNGDTTSSFFGRAVNVRIVGEGSTTSFCESFCDSSGEGCLAVVDVAWVVCVRTHFIGRGERDTPIVPIFMWGLVLM